MPSNMARQANKRGAPSLPTVDAHPPEQQYSRIFRHSIVRVLAQQVIRTAPRKEDDTKKWHEWIKRIYIDKARAFSSFSPILPCGGPSPSLSTRHARHAHAP